MHFILAAVCLASSLAAHAGIVPQQRGKACAAVWDLGLADATPGAKKRQPWTLECTDGDPVCDTDGFVDGTCHVAVRACVEQTSIAGCTPRRVRRLRLAPATAAQLPDLELPPLGQGAACGPPATFAVRASATLGGVPLTLHSRSRRRKGRSAVRIACRPRTDTSRPCRNRLPGLPSRAHMAWRSEGSDVDLGFSGEAHNFGFVDAGGLDLCLDGCDGTTDTVCEARTPGTRLTVPLPLITNGVPICLDPRLDGALTGTLDVATGAVELTGMLAADAYVLQPLDRVCPRCGGDGTIGSTGTCQGGRNAGAPCTVEAIADVVFSTPSTYQLSSDCLPDGKPTRTLALPLALSTGERRLDGPKPCEGQTDDDQCGSGSCTADCTAVATSKGGLNQTCCSTKQTLPCFPSAPDAQSAIVRTGSPAVLASSPRRGVLADVTCLPTTTDATVDILWGVPGPAALLLPFDLRIATDD